ncbi:hypothetical protein [Pseudomonas fluorescens]|uniref:Uncharacterized protein n=1 Tax=Pseudomonas fluorescens TaxID=294 RepID=A0A5E7VMR1_PSEFL|nr:hypothetical protein [Pseudomonas fluorescens]VVQ23877.1 hypothetical protein PS941_05649 [Pseudomonas fluorescens]
MERDDTAVEVNVNFTSEDINNNIEIIEVKYQTTYSEDTHYLLIETKLKSSNWSLQGIPNSSSRITVRATYLYGSRGGVRSGQFISEMGGELNYSQKSVKLTNGSVMIDGSMRGLHVGTYLFHKIVSWAKQFDPAFTVVPISVISGDADRENKDRRNKLYTNSGIRFIWDGAEGMGGQSDPTLKISELIPYANWPNITRNHGLSALDNIWRDFSTLKEKSRGLRASKRYYRREYETIRARLRAIAGFLNFPGYIFCILLGLAIGRALGWYQGS